MDIGRIWYDGDAERIKKNKKRMEGGCILSWQGCIWVMFIAIGREFTALRQGEKGIPGEIKIAVHVR